MKHTTLSSQTPRQETLAFLKDFARVYQPQQNAAIMAMLLKRKGTIFAKLRPFFKKVGVLSVRLLHSIPDLIFSVIFCKNQPLVIRLAALRNKFSYIRPIKIGG